MSDPAPIKFRIPRQNLAECTVFRATADDARSWAQNLPIANTKLVVQNLRAAIEELNHVDIAPDVRFDIMEELRPSLHVALSTMSRRFLNQPLVMPEEPRQMSELADKLYSLATTAYTIIAVHTLQQRDNIYRVNPAKLLGEAIHRAIGLSGRKMLQTFQLHQPVQAHSWRELHQLYAMAERQQLAKLKVEDELYGSGTITTRYLQVLMLGCCKPTQLRQSDLVSVYHALHEWGNLVQLVDCRTGTGLFRVDLDKDQPAVYSSLYPATGEALCRLVDTSKLVDHLNSLRPGGETPGNFRTAALDKDNHLSANMLDHMIKSLGSMSTRNFKRSASGEMLGVSIGMSSTHYHMAGRKTFDQILSESHYEHPLNSEAATSHFMDQPDIRDSWEQANPHDDHALEEDRHYHGEVVDDPTLEQLNHAEAQEISPEERYPVYPVHMVDASPGGYCLEWSLNLPSKVRSGDLIGVRESGRSEWILAAIRWISQLEDAKSLIGVELLSPKAMSYGARIQQTGLGVAPIMRVLLLPEIKLVGQPHTLITPRAGFKERQKVILIREGEEFLIQLQHQISTTGNFSQFDFRYIKHIEQVVAEEKPSLPAPVYDSLWERI